MREKLMKARYCRGEEQTALAVFNRVANALGKDSKEINDFFNLMAANKFLPNSPTLMNAGTDSGMLSACFVLPVEDNMDSIFTAIKNAAMIHKWGGGTGFSFNNLRPKGSKVRSTEGVASGPVSFMKVFDASTAAVKQGGKRRGANMGVLNVDHPDILDFITCKNTEGEIENFNISVMIPDWFMNAVVNERWDEVCTSITDDRHITIRDVWDKIIDGIWTNGEPGVLFYDTINADKSIISYSGEIEATNPCGEQPLAPYESCNLGSINLEEFVDSNGQIKIIDLTETIRIATRFLDRVIDNNRFPICEIDMMSRRYRKIGLGYMGLAGMLMKMGIPYDSQEGQEVAALVMDTLQKVSRQESERLAINSDEGVPGWGRRNLTTTTIAPTGSISLIADCTSGIEPVFALAYKRTNTLAELGVNEYTVVNPIFKSALSKYLEANYKTVLYDSIIDYAVKYGSIQNHPDLDAKFKSIFKTATDIHWTGHVNMQATCQKYCDAAISKTINMPKNETREEIAAAIVYAWSQKCKGVTIYRTGSRESVVLSVGESKPEVKPSIEDTEMRPIVPEKRPKELFGVTYEMKSGCGDLFVTINYKDGKPFEIFTFTNGGGCQANMEALCRSVSGELRSNIDVRYIIRQLNKVKCSVALRKKDAEGKSCADIIGNCLQAAIGDEPDFSLPTSISMPTVTDKSYPMCPECGAQLMIAEGCLTCSSCGWSKCS